MLQAGTTDRCWHLCTEFKENRDLHSLKSSTLKELFINCKGKNSDLAGKKLEDPTLRIKVNIVSSKALWPHVPLIQYTEKYIIALTQCSHGKTWEEPTADVLRITTQHSSKVSRLWKTRETWETLMAGGDQGDMKINAMWQPGLDPERGCKMEKVCGIKQCWLLRWIIIVELHKMLTLRGPESLCCTPKTNTTL